MQSVKEVNCAVYISCCHLFDNRI